MSILYWSLIGIGIAGVIYGLGSLPSSVQFLRFVERELDSPIPESYQPRATVLLPCKGADTHLFATLRAVRSQHYARYEVICAVESADDPAYRMIQSAIVESDGAPMRCVVAPRATRCAQKIENLLAAIAVAAPETEVYVFVDSDAVPPPHWLAALIAPLADENVAATTGFRFYVSPGGWAKWARSLWNVAAFTFLGEHTLNFCWGGSTGIRRSVFAGLEIPSRWRRALSEDYEITRAAHAAKLRIRFVPKCVIPSDDETSWREFLPFARRQLIITRVAKPGMFLLALGIATLYNVAGWTLFGLTLVLLVRGATTTAIVVGALYLALLGSAAVKGWLRQRAVARLFPDPGLRRGLLLGDSLGAPVVGLLHQVLMLAALSSNRFWWRGIRYDMRALDDVRILDRRP